MKLELTNELAWPTCYYDRSSLCGSRHVDNKPNAHEAFALENPSWHVAGLCECPSCPIRVAISTALHVATRP